MLVQRNYAEERVIESYTITGVTRADMYKMTQVYDRVMGIIGNHINKKAEKKEYLSDDDLYDVAAILDVFTENNRTSIKKSCFEKKKEEILKMHEELLKNSDIDNEVLIKGGPGAWPETPIIGESKNF